MYEIPNNLDLTKLYLQTVNAITFTSNTINILFENFHNHIQTYGDFSLVLKNEIFECDEIFPIKSDYGFIHLIGKKLINTEVKQDNCMLSLLFEEEIVLNLRSSPSYESFIIHLGDEEIII